MTQRMKYSSQSFTNNETGAKVQRLLALNFKCHPPPSPSKKIGVICTFRRTPSELEEQRKPSLCSFGGLKTSARGWSEGRKVCSQHSFVFWSFLLRLGAVIASRSPTYRFKLVRLACCAVRSRSGVSPLPPAAEGVRIPNTPVPQICPEVSTLTYGKYWRRGPREEAATCHAW